MPQSNSPLDNSPSGQTEPLESGTPSVLLESAVPLAELSSLLVPPPSVERITGFLADLGQTRGSAPGSFGQSALQFAQSRQPLLPGGVSSRGAGASTHSPGDPIPYRSLNFSFAQPLVRDPNLFPTIGEIRNFLTWLRTMSEAQASAENSRTQALAQELGYGSSDRPLSPQMSLASPSPRETISDAPPFLPVNTRARSTEGTEPDVLTRAYRAERSGSAVDAKESVKVPVPEPAKIQADSQRSQAALPVQTFRRNSDPTPEPQESEDEPPTEKKSTKSKNDRPAPDTPSSPEPILSREVGSRALERFNLFGMGMALGMQGMDGASFSAPIASRMPFTQTFYPGVSLDTLPFRTTGTMGTALDPTAAPAARTIGAMPAPATSVYDGVPGPAPAIGGMPAPTVSAMPPPPAQLLVQQQENTVSQARGFIGEQRVQEDDFYAVADSQPPPVARPAIPTVSWLGTAPPEPETATEWDETEPVVNAAIASTQPTETRQRLSRGYTPVFSGDALVGEALTPVSLPAIGMPPSGTEQTETPSSTTQTNGRLTALGASRSFTFPQKTGGNESPEGEVPDGVNKPAAFAEAIREGKSMTGTVNLLVSGGTEPGQTDSLFPAARQKQLGSSAAPLTVPFQMQQDGLTRRNILAGRSQLVPTVARQERRDVLPDESPIAGVSTENESLDPTLGQLTLFAPSLQVASADSERSGAAVRMDWTSIARGTGPLTSGGLSALIAALPPGSQAIYPALPPGTGGANAVNLALAPSLLRDLLARGYGERTATLAGEAASRGMNALPTIASAEPLSAALVPSLKRPNDPEGGILGKRAAANGPAGALEEAGSGGAKRGGALDFLGMPIRLAPSLGGRSELAQETAVRGGGLTGSDTAASMVRPEKFTALQKRLFPAFGSITTEPDKGEWRKVAPSFGLRDSDPTTLLAPDARIPNRTDTDSVSQTGIVSSPEKNLSTIMPPSSGGLLNLQRNPVWDSGVGEGRFHTPSMSSAGTPLVSLFDKPSQPFLTNTGMRANTNPFAYRSPTQQTGGPAQQTEYLPSQTDSLPPQMAREQYPRGGRQSHYSGGGSAFGGGNVFDSTPLSGGSYNLAGRGASDTRIAGIDSSRWLPRSAPMEGGGSRVPFASPFVHDSGQETKSTRFPSRERQISYGQTGKGELPLSRSFAPIGGSAGATGITMPSYFRFPEMASFPLATGRTGNTKALENVSGMRVQRSVSGQGRANSGAEARGGNESGSDPRRSRSDATGTGDAGNTAAEVNLLASEVYMLLKRRFAQEAERHGRR